jgi:hypothetical protein
MFRFIELQCGLHHKFTSSFLFLFSSDPLEEASLSIHSLFAMFVHHQAACDHGLLLDLLTSNETKFLLFFTKYLKCVLGQWTQFVAACSMCHATTVRTQDTVNRLVDYSDSSSSDVDEATDSNPGLDTVMAVLIRLRLVIERLNESSLFPYNPKSLLNLLERVEELYEK